MAHAISKVQTDCTDVQADLSLCWSHEAYRRFCHYRIRLICPQDIFLLPSADSRRTVVSFWQKNVHNTG